MLQCIMCITTRFANVSVLYKTSQIVNVFNQQLDFRPIGQGQIYFYSTFTTVCATQNAVQADNK